MLAFDELPSASEHPPLAATTKANAVGPRWHGGFAGTRAVWRMSTTHRGNLRAAPQGLPQPRNRTTLGKQRCQMRVTGKLLVKSEEKPIWWKTSTKSVGWEKRKA